MWISTVPKLCMIRDLHQTIRERELYPKSIPRTDLLNMQGAMLVRRLFDLWSLRGCGGKSDLPSLCGRLLEVFKA